MFKKIDRYIIARFVPPIVLCLVIVYGLYASFDLLQSLDALKREGFGSGLRVMMQYYLYFFPVFSLDLTPGAILIAAGLLLVRMSRHRELLALKATGISIRRITLPIFVTTITLSVGVAYLKDFQIPELAKRCDVLKNKVQTNIRHNLLVRDFHYEYEGLALPGVDEQKQLEGDIVAEKYNPSRKEMEGVFILHRYPDRALRMTIQAKSGRWKKRRLILENVVIYRFNRAGLQEGANIVRKSLPVKTNLQSGDLDLAEEVVSTHLTLNELHRLIEEYPSIPGYKVIYHSKVSSIFASVILLLIGIPLIVGSAPNPRSRFVGVSICIAVSTGYYVFSFVCNNMGNAGTVGPILASWLPTVVMGALGIILFDHLHT